MASYAQISSKIKLRGIMGGKQSCNCITMGINTEHFIKKLYILNSQSVIQLNVAQIYNEVEL